MSDRNELNSLLADLDIEAWLDLEGIDYRRTTGKSGRELNIKECPVCGGYGWKVYFNPNTGLGVCFHGSHPQDKQFNKFRLLQSYSGKRGRAFVEYVEDVCTELGWTPPRKAEIKSEVTLVAGKVGLPPNQRIPSESGTIPDYLLKRNLTQALCEYFDLRLCESGEHVYWDGDAGYAKSQDFSQRIIIPVYDLKGNLCTFQGRDTTGLAEKKYLFPATLPASGRFLYNAHNAIGKETLILGEGVFDCIGIKKALLTEPTLFPYIEPIATFGMHLSGGMAEANQDQIAGFLELKRHGLKSVVMMWDSEDATIDNLIKAANKLIGIGLKIRVAVLKEKDPGEAEPKHIIDAYYRAKPMDKGLMLRLKVRGFAAMR